MIDTTQMNKAMCSTVDGPSRQGIRRTSANSLSDVKLHYETEPGKLFNYDAFLHYYQNGTPADIESWSFLRYFTSMPLFKRLVERWVLEKEYKELQVFINRSYEWIQGCSKFDEKKEGCKSYITLSLIFLTYV